MELRPGTAQEAGMVAERIERIPRRAQEWANSGINQALVLLVARRGVIVFHEAFGRMHPEPDAPAARLDTIFPMSSVSKPITATAAMILVEDGLLGLNRPVQEYIPEFTGEGKDAVMVHHLLTHTSGWEDETIGAQVEAQRGKVELPTCPATQHRAVHEELCLAYDVPLKQPPGTEMSYCSWGYNLLGEIVRRVSGKSLTDFAAERIFEPLGMSDTSYILPDTKRDRMVRRRPLDPPPFGLDDPEYHRQPWPEAGVLSTAMDMGVFMQMFLNGGSYGGERILSPATVAEMTRDQIPGVAARFGTEYFPEAGWGYGWEIHGNKKDLRGGSLHSASTFAHGGSGGAYVWADPVDDVVGVHLSVSRAARSFELEWNMDLFANMVMAAIA